MSANAADFYIQEPNGDLIWMGSKGFDGQPWNDELKPVVEAVTRPIFEQALVALADSCDDFTRRDQGYPYGRKSSAESPFTYVWLSVGYVAIYKKGRPADDDFPTMKWPKLDDIRQAHVQVKSNISKTLLAAAVESAEDVDR